MSSSDCGVPATAGGVTRRSRTQTNLPAYPRDEPVHSVFSWHAGSTPNAPALLYGEQVVTYQQLAERANRFARRLEKLGVGPGSIVGLLTGRSIDAIVAWLATLKCGGAYLP